MDFTLSAAEGRSELPPADDVVLAGVLHRDSVPGSSTAALADRFDPTPFDFPTLDDKAAYLAGTILLRCGLLDILNRIQTFDTTVEQSVQIDARAHGLTTNL